MTDDSDFDFRDKVAIVTGGAGGLGSATCRALAAAGVEVVVSDVAVDAGEALAAELGGHFFAADVASLEENEALVAFAVERCGGLDLIHLNAGIATGCGIGETFDLELYRRAMAINFDGVVFGTQAAMPALRARGGGAIVATASLAGLTSVPLDPIYAGNKHAVVGFARSVGMAFAHENIRFNAVCPGFAETAIITDIRDAIIESGVPIIPAEFVAEAVLRIFASDTSGEAWFVQAGRDPEPFGFRGIPGPRGAPA